MADYSNLTDAELEAIVAKGNTQAQPVQSNTLQSATPAPQPNFPTSYADWTDAQLEEAANRGKGPDVNSGPGFISLFRKARQSLSYYDKRTRERLSSGKEMTPDDGPNLNWDTLEPEEKRAAIAFSAMALPGGGARALVAKMGMTGILRPVFTALGYGAEGAAIGGGIQAAGNIATGEPITKDVTRAAAFGAGANTLLGGVGSMMPTVSKSAANMMGQGIVPTVGQAVDKGNVAGRVIGRSEEILGSFPIVGEIARNSRARGEQEWRNVTLDRINPEGGLPLSGSTQDRLGQLKGALGSKYDDAATLVDIPTNSPEFTGWLNLIITSVKDPQKALTDKTKKDILGYLQTRLRASVQHGPNGPYIPGDILKGLESDIGKWQQAEYRASRGGGKDAFESGRAAQALKETKQGLRDARSQLSPEAAAIYKDIDPKYADYLSIRDAAKSAAGDISDFSPMQLLRALRQKEPPNNFVSGGTPGSLLENAYQARQVFRNDLATSGTSERLLPFLIAGGSVGGAYGQTDLPYSDYATYLAAIPLLAAGGSRLGQDSILRLMMAGEKAAPAIRRFGSASAINIMPD